MRKHLFRLLSLCIALFLLLPVQIVSAEETTLSLSPYIRSREKRHFVESMISYHLRENETVRKTLKDGYAAVFFFEGCSDNMDNPELSDLSYYRVSAVCIVIKLDDAGNPVITYFNEDCSTLPDRPLEYGAWQLEDEGEVGPATICDGTYELYSVYHGGAYEALHLRSSYEDETIPAVYMKPDGFVTHPANAINIHTRTGNHIIEKAMWSAGCLLVGDGEWMDYANLIVSSYYSTYERFRIDQRVGCVTVNRQHIEKKMYDLYQNPDAVDTLLVSSRCELPQVYLERCTEKEQFQPKMVRMSMGTEAMSLPCSNSTDARSIPVTKLEKDDKIDICGSVVNTKGQMWYEVSFFGENCFVPAGNAADIVPTLWEQIMDFFRN